MKLSTEINMTQEQKLEIALARLEERVAAMQEDMRELNWDNSNKNEICDNTDVSYEAAAEEFKNTLNNND